MPQAPKVRGAVSRALDAIVRGGIFSVARAGDDPVVSNGTERILVTAHPPTFDEDRQFQSDTWNHADVHRSAAQPRARRLEFTPCPSARTRRFGSRGPSSAWRSTARRRAERSGAARRPRSERRQSLSRAVDTSGGQRRSPRRSPRPTRGAARERHRRRRRRQGTRSPSRRRSGPRSEGRRRGRWIPSRPVPTTTRGRRRRGAHPPRRRRHPRARPPPPPPPAPPSRQSRRRRSSVARSPCRRPRSSASSASGPSPRVSRRGRYPNRPGERGGDESLRTTRTAIRLLPSKRSPSSPATRYS